MNSNIALIIFKVAKNNKMIYSANLYQSIITEGFRNLSKMHCLALTFFIIAFFQSLIGYTQDPFIPKYDAVKRSERCFTITWETNNQFGAVWWADKVDFAQDTAFNFVVYMGDRDGNGADGIAFVMHQDPRDITVDPGQQVIIGGAGTWDLQAATGDDGGGLGFAMHQSRVGPNTIPGPHGPGDDPENHKIQPSVSIEMDTWNNTDVPDGRNGTDANGVAQPTSPFYGWDHTSVVYNGDIYGQQQIIEDALGNTGRILPLKPSYAFGAANNPDGSPFHNIEDDRCYMFQVRWITNADGTQTLQLWADVYNGSTNIDGLQMVMTHTDDMLGNVFGGNTIMRFGFTGSTGGSINEQTICLLGENLAPFAQDDYASIPMNTSTIVDVEANDNDPDGDQLHVPVIIDPARNGQAVIFDSLGTNYLRYTPNTNFVGLDTLQYVTCDVNSIKCYAKCDTAFVFIEVGCVPFDIAVNATSANTVCSVTVPANGAAQAEITGSALSGTLWYEGFENLSNGTTVDNGTSAWSLSNSGSCTGSRIVEVVDNRFRARNTGCEIVFETQVIDITSVSDVRVTVDLFADGPMENADYLQVYYVLDGGAETPLNNGLHVNNFNNAIASINNLNGNTLKIVIRVRNSANNETYHWDNIHVTAIGAGVPNVSYNWYQGSAVAGPIVFTGSVNNSLSHGEYTVQAIDNNTGCPSNPYTVTIDSTGYQLTGGFIEQRSPFVSCELPYTGELGAGIFNGTDTVTTGFNFEWYFQEDPKIPSFIQRTGAIAQNLDSREYTIVITEIATGCDTTINAEVPNAVSLPTVTATKISDITSCTDPNSGVGAANVNGITAGYRFEWYAGPSIGGGPPDYIGSTINTFPAGTYTVQAIDSTTFCPSDPASITIEDLTDTPNLLVFVDAENTSCDPAAPNGQLSGAVDESGTPTTSGYAFNWYKGPNDIVPARPGYTGGPMADMLEAGPYRLVVIQDITNCTSFVDTLIQDLTVTPPDITLASTDVNSCLTPNGTITVTLDPALDPADFEYEVYRGNGIIADSLLVTSSTNVIPDLPAGSYTVIAVDINTSCASNPATITINDATVNPTAILNILPQVACEPSLVTGSITASVNTGLVSDYTYEWFSDVVDGIDVPPSSANGEVISGLDSGEYILRITNTLSGCANVYYPVVHLAQVFPIDSVAATPSTFCAPNGNGELRGYVLNETHANYIYTWRDGLGVQLTETIATVTGREPGDYTLQVRDENTGCVSNVAPVTVYDNTVTPIPTLVATNNSSCDVTDPNGQIEVTTTNEDPTYTLSNYDYAWFDDGGTEVTTTGGSFGEIVNSISEGTYELRILNTITSCDNSVLAQIIDINIMPVITAAIVTTPATRCDDPFMSTAEVTEINGSTDLSGYTFTWLTASDVVLLANSPSPRIEDFSDADGFEMPAGNYKVIAYNSFDCASDPFPFVIEDNTTDPVFTLESTPNTSCAWIPATQTGMSNGSLSVNYAGTPAITNYYWERESTSSPGTWTSFGGSVNVVTGLHELDNYRVSITDENACTSTNYGIVNKVTDPNPYIGFGPVADLTDCSSPNGELEALILIGNPPPAGFNFEFALTGQMNRTQLDNGVFDQLEAGDYQVTVVNTFTQCQSNTIDTAIHIYTDLEFTIIPNSPANCTGDLGSISIAGRSNSGLNEPPATGPGFAYNWFVGSDKSTALNAANVSVPDIWSSLASDLLPNNYTIEITDNSTSCSIDTVIYLSANSVPAFINADVTPSDQCYPGNGRVELTIDPATFGIIPPATVADYSSYEYILFTGNFIDATWNMTGTTEYSHILAGDIPAGGPVVFTGLEPGIYTVVAKEAFGDFCLSETRTFEIDLNFDFAPLNLVQVRPDNTCATLTGNGQLNETNNAFYTTGAEFEYTWYRGTDVSVVVNIIEGPTSATKITPDTLRAGLYTLFVEIVGAGPGLGCITSGVVNLNKQIDDIRITDAPVTPNDICEIPGNGEIFIQNIRENGSDLGTAGFDNFTIYNNALTNITGSTMGLGTSVDSWNGLNIGTYYVSARNATTLCVTPPFQAEVIDISEDPVIAVVMTNPDYGCDPATLANGVLTASVPGNPSADYTFEWTDGLGLSIFSDVANNLTANESQKTYNVTVTDNVGVNRGCVSTRNITLLHQPTTITITSVLADPQTICGPNGEIQVVSISEYDPFTAMINTITQPVPFTGIYNAALYESNDINNPSSASYSSFNDVTGNFGFDDIVNGTFETEVLPAGTYYIRAQNLATGCDFGPPTQVIIRDNSRNPVISALLDSPDFACFASDPGNPGHTGQLTAVAFGGSDGDDVTTNFNFTWTQTSSGTPVPTGGFSYTATDLWPDTYTLTVIDTDDLDYGCISTREYIVASARRNIQLFASGGDQTICNPDGQVQIDSILVDGVKVPSPENTGWTSFLMDASRADLNAPETGFISINDPFENISAATYLVQAQDNSSLCYSNFAPVVIYDASTDPVISVSIDNPQWSKNPDPLTWTGALSAQVMEIGGAPGIYDIEWYSGIGTATSLNQQTLAVDSLDRGLYTITAINNATGCDSRYYVLLPYEYLEPTFLTALTPQTVCAPNNGAIEVTNIALQGNPDDLDDYEFSIYHGNYNAGNTPDALVPGDNAGTVYDNINPNSYYIIAKENWWWVESYPVKVDVLDSTTNPIITFDVSDYRSVTSCDQSVFSDGALGINVYEDPNNPYVQGGPYTYDFTWISEATGQVIPGETTNIISGLNSGDYTVLVVNQVNNCEAQQTFTIMDESVIPVVVASQTPNTNCAIEIANGIATANVVNTTNNYVYQWYAGTGESTVPDFDQKTWYGRQAGFYTIVAVDLSLSTCKSVPVTIEVENATKNPVIVINEISPVTNCDPERPNGVLSAVTQDGISGHTFNWSLDGNLISTGPVASNLGLFRYDLIVINNVTLCEASMQAGPSELLGLVPAPDVDILSDRTSCLNPDGFATASLSGNVVDYIFRYYNKFSGEELSNFFQDYIIYDLDTSTYLVTAEDRTTGCVSEPTEFAIADDTYYPEIDIIALPSSCMDPTGEANVIISDMTRDFSVTWIGDNGFTAQEKELVFIPVGKYLVIVEGTDGCTTEAEAEVKGDVVIYNAVSPNHDGLNEFFQILCMEYFLNNNVKIFNRAGLLVYEQNYYDPTDPGRRFEGVSNKGASIAGTELPIGTYFYVVDKSDGSKPKVGYLELNR